MPPPTLAPTSADAEMSADERDEADYESAAER